MKLATHNNWVTLYFQSCDRVNGNFVSESGSLQFYPVLTLPRLEMHWKDAGNLADDFLCITHSPAWMRQCRRTMLPGDVFTLFNNFYIFNRYDGALPALTHWPHWSIELTNLEKLRNARTCTTQSGLHPRGHPV